MKIYVLTKGFYSDYHVLTATTDLTQAEAIAKKFGADIEEYENAEVMLHPCWLIRFDKNGVVCECRMDTDEYGYEEVGLCGFDIAGRVYVHVVADTVEQAIKAGAERRAKFLAEKMML